MAEITLWLPADDAYHAEFVCCVCDEPSKDRFAFWREEPQHEPVCNGCISLWGLQERGPVLSRLSFKRLQQLSVVTRRLQWEIKNGRRNQYR